jgi:hypothetical protein
MNDIEMTRVREQNRRARFHNAVATLTIAEWEQTLADFHSICAYCQVRPFSVLEHFIPFGHVGEGTYVNNCLPACQSCNTLKKNYIAEEVIHRFGRERVEYLQAYLAGCLPLEESMTVRHVSRSKIGPRLKREKVIPIPLPVNVPYLTLDRASQVLGMRQVTLYCYLKDLNITTHKFWRDRRRYISIADVKRIITFKECPWKS